MKFCRVKNWHKIENQIIKDPNNENLREKFLNDVSNKLKPFFETSYFIRDLFHYNYEPVYYPSISSRKQIVFRGGNLETKKYILSIGAADCFGVFHDEPLSHKIEKLTNLQVVNLGLGGKGIIFYKEFIYNFEEIASKAELIFCHLNSLRSHPLSGLRTLNGGRIALDEDDRKINIHQELSDLQQNDFEKFKYEILNIQLETFKVYKKLFKNISVPKILLIISNKPKPTPLTIDGYNNSRPRGGGFPHYLTVAYQDFLKEIFDHTIISDDCHRTTKIIDRFNKSIRKNDYYVSQLTINKIFSQLKKKIFSK